MVLILSISIAFQLFAVLIAMRLIKVTEKYFAWILIAIAITFMALRRTITLVAILQGTKIVTGTTAAEYVALSISILLSLGLFFMIPIFKSINKNQNDLVDINIELRTAKTIAEDNENSINMLFELSPIGLALAKLTGELVQVNKAYADIIGYEMAETLHLTYWDVTPKKYAEQEQIQLKNLSETGSYGPYEKEYIHKSGKLIPVRLQGKIIEKDGEKFIWSSIEDISDIKNKDNKIKKQNQKLLETNKELIIAKEKAEESNQLKTEFIRNLSHEIRTPMNSILGFSHFLKKDNLSHKKRNHFINIISNSSQQLLRVIDDILEISKLNSKQIKLNERKICLNDLLLEYFSVFDVKAKENQTPLYLKRGLSDEESNLITDESKLNKILSNLIENALKFTNKGYIEIGYKLVNLNEIEIYVKDTGIGIKPENQKLIFDRFSREETDIINNVGGLGLGLSIAKENAKLLGGKITLNSLKGEGSTFFVTIPYKKIKNEVASEIKSETLIMPLTYEPRNEIENILPTKNIKILVAEDEEVNYLYIETTLDESGIQLQLLHAKNGYEAVEICKKHADINLVLMDLKMPIQNGFEATQAIKKFRPNLPIIAQTAYTTKEDINKALSAGCIDFISKPIDSEKLNEMVKKYLAL